MRLLKAHVPAIPRRKIIASPVEVAAYVGTHERIVIISINVFSAEKGF